MIRVPLLPLLAFVLLAAQEPDTPGLTVVVEGVRNSRGVVGVLIFDSGRGWPEDVRAAYRSNAAPARPGATTLTFDGLPYGSYAVVVLHDENENQELDRNLFGVPREGWGMSNNPKARGAAPDFSRARFDFGNGVRLRVRLNY